MTTSKFTLLDSTHPFFLPREYEVLYCKFDRRQTIDDPRIFSFICIFFGGEGLESGFPNRAWDGYMLGGFENFFWESGGFFIFIYLISLVEEKTKKKLPEKLFLFVPPFFFSK